MKQLAFVLLLVVLTSCGKSSEPHDASFVIEFRPGVDTRSYITSATDPEFMEGFAVFASKTDRDGRSAEIMTNMRVYSEGAGWTYDGRVLWAPECEHSFLGVFPHKMTSPDGFDGENYVFRDLNTIDETSGKAVGTDIMYGRYSTFYKYGEVPTKVRMEMRHAFSALTFRIRNASMNNIERISDIRFGQLLNRVTSLTLPRDASKLVVMERGTTRAGVVFPDLTERIPSGDTELRSLTEALTIVPQDFLDVKLPLEFKVKFEGIDAPKQVSYDIASIPLETDIPEYHYTYRPGLHYIYNINITNNYITCEVTVVDWIEDTPIELE